jgi:hypothetical protein
MIYKKISNRRRRSDGKRGPLRLPRMARELTSKSLRFQTAYAKTLNVIAKMRTERISLNRAAAEVGVDPRSVTRLGKSALRREVTGRYSAKSGDRLLRVLQTPGQKGMHEIAVRGSKQARLVAEHANAVRKYIQTGDARDLRRFRDKKVITDIGDKVLLLTDLVELDVQGSAGELKFESIYARSA